MYHSLYIFCCYAATRHVARYAVELTVVRRQLYVFVFFIVQRFNSGLLGKVHCTDRLCESQFFDIFSRIANALF